MSIGKGVTIWQSATRQKNAQRCQFPTVLGRHRDVKECAKLTGMSGAHIPRSDGNSIGLGVESTRGPYWHLPGLYSAVCRVWPGAKGPDSAPHVYKLGQSFGGEQWYDAHAIKSSCCICAVNAVGLPQTRPMRRATMVVPGA